MFRLVIGALVCVVCLGWILAPGAWGKGKVGAFTATAAVGSGSAVAVAATDSGVGAGLDAYLKAGYDATFADAGLANAAVATMAEGVGTGTSSPGTAVPLADLPPDLLMLLAALGALAVLVMLLLALTGGLKRLPKEWRGMGAFGGAGLAALVAAVLGGLSLPEALAAGLSAGLAAPGAFSVLKPLLGRVPLLGRILGMAASSPAPVKITVEMAMNEDPNAVVTSIFDRLKFNLKQPHKTPEGEKEKDPNA